MHTPSLPLSLAGLSTARAFTKQRGGTVGVPGQQNPPERTRRTQGRNPAFHIPGVTRRSTETRTHTHTQHSSALKRLPWTRLRRRSVGSFGPQTAPPPSDPGTGGDGQSRLSRFFEGLALPTERVYHTPWAHSGELLQYGGRSPNKTTVRIELVGSIRLR